MAYDHKWLEKHCDCGAHSSKPAEKAASATVMILEGLLCMAVLITAFVAVQQGWITPL